jgi:hypothetical protein
MTDFVVFIIISVVGEATRDRKSNTRLPRVQKVTSSTRQLLKDERRDILVWRVRRRVLRYIAFKFPNTFRVGQEIVLSLGASKSLLLDLFLNIDRDRLVRLGI